jgi:hypothetical protein
MDRERETVRYSHIYMYIYRNREMQPYSLALSGRLQMHPGGLDTAQRDTEAARGADSGAISRDIAPTGAILQIIRRAAAAEAWVGWTGGAVRVLTV